MIVPFLARSVDGYGRSAAFLLRARDVPVRYPWLKKGFDAVCEDAGVFLRDDAITTLGVGKNMVRSIRHWCLTAGVLAESRDGGGVMRPTDLRSRLLADDGLEP